MKINLTDVYTCIYYCLTSVLLRASYSQEHALIYTVVMPPVGIYPDFLLHHGGCASCTDQIYYTHNIILLLTKQKLKFICGVNNMVMLKEMMMHMNWLTQFYTYIKTVRMMKFILLMHVQ